MKVVILNFFSIKLPVHLGHDYICLAKGLHLIYNMRCYKTGSAGIHFAIPALSDNHIMKECCMLTLQIHHIGYLVKKMDAAILSFKSLGYEVVQDTTYDDIRKVNICFLKKDGYCIELVSPTSEDSVVSGLLRKYKNSPYHICYETENFDEDYRALQSNGFITIDAPTPAPALHNREVVFLTSPVMGMIELIGK